MIDKLSPVFNMASSRSEENVNLKHFQQLKVSQCWSVLQFYFGHFCLECLADVIANISLAIFVVWQMLLPFTILVADVIPLVLCHVWLNWHEWRQMLLPLILVTDVIVTYWYWSLWLMLLSHMMLVLLFGRYYAMWCDTTSNCCKGTIYLPMADVITIDGFVRLMLYIDVIYRWCCLAGVIARVAGVIAT